MIYRIACPDNWMYQLSADGIIKSKNEYHIRVQQNIHCKKADGKTLYIFTKYTSAYTYKYEYKNDFITKPTK